uniref:Allene oxide synthase, chloroplastic n=1 Tax=Linum usitatissimum TaxID=4006 RepID=CP74_LINUS|nr:RecName: Full=Allene oxide synthase, chloroplastic; AltName: Full=Cytochrome P450 74A; AltName: Full=Hydroperoxide dehydrase; Flags: Precursor [Linum usitatissimum]AAA03353.1 allene oxide synthase [Linum usitatissimum]
MASSALNNLVAVNPNTLSPSPKSTPLPNTFSNLRRVSAFRPIKASLFGDSPIKIPGITSQPPPSSDETTLPIRQIPGDYGLPGIGPIQDRLDYFYNQGREEFFKSRLQKYKSTVYRANMPPGPFIASNPRVIVLLDAKSFPVLFDMSKVEKKDLFTGTYMPSTELTGGYRILSYLDPSEPNHTKLKQLLFNLIKNRRDYVIPEFSSSFTDLCEVVEYDLATKGKAAFNDPAEQAAFNFLSRAFFGVKPIDTPLGKDAPSLISKWVLFNLAPILSVGLPKEVEEATLHSVRLPPLLVQNDYHRLYEFFTSAAGSVLDEAEQSGISRDEACHNILFAVCFNSWGGFKILFPSLMKWIGRAGLELHTKLAQEIRSAIQSTGGGKVTMAAMEQMPLMKSVVYETLRIEPPVALQYGKAKKDFILESHEAAYQVKEGEMLFGYQPFATKDPKIFDRPEEFVADRFVGEGVKLMEYVMWSNGPETETPSVANKQCAGKDFVVMAARLFVVELFKRYDSFDIEVGTSSLGASITLTSLKRSTF